MCIRDSLVATLTTDKNGEAEVNNLYLGNYYVKEITPSEGYLLDEEEHDVVCDYEGDLVAEVSRSTTSAEQVIKQPFQLIKVSDNGEDVYKRQPTECVGCPYYQGNGYCFPCMRKLIGK